MTLVLLYIHNSSEGRFSNQTQLTFFLILQENRMWVPIRSIRMSEQYFKALLTAGLDHLGASNEYTQQMFSQRKNVHVTPYLTLCSSCFAGNGEEQGGFYGHAGH